VTVGNFDENKHFKTLISKDVSAMLLGAHLGSGQFRDVFAHASSPEYVVKVEDVARSFHNIAEWELWKMVEDTPMARWFAPCSHISPAGSVLVMRRVEHLPEKLLPKRVPYFMSDLKQENWGWFEDRPVCCDYGYTTLLWQALQSKKMKTAEWHRR